MLIVKDVAVIATGNQNGGIWWVMKRTLDKIQIFSAKFVGIQQFFLRPVFFSFSPSCRSAYQISSSWCIKEDQTFCLKI